MEELWKTVQNFENYEVSNLGRVKSQKGIMKTSRNGEYMEVTLWKNGKRRRVKVHRLIAETFIPNPNNLPQVNHINENKTDNRVANLEWCTPQQNVLHSLMRHYSERIKKNQERESVNKPIYQYDLDGNLIKRHISIRAAEKEIGRIIDLTAIVSQNYVWRRAPVSKESIVALRERITKVKGVKKIIYSIDKEFNVEVYNSVSEAARKSGIHQGSISNYIYNGHVDKNGVYWSSVNPFDVFIC